MIIPALRLARLYYSLPLACGLWVIAYYLSDGDLSGRYVPLIFATAALWCVICAGYIFNDLFDLAADKINSPARPLAAGDISRLAAIKLGVALNIAALIFCLGTPISFAAVLIPVMVLLFFYDRYSKKIGILKDILVAVLVVSLYPLAFAIIRPAVSPRLNILYIHPLWLFITTIAYQMIKDTLDISGDNFLSRSSLAYRNTRWFHTASRTLIVAAGLLALLPYFLGWCDGIYLTAASVALVLCVAAAFVKPKLAICYIYAQVVLITLGSFVDMLFNLNLIIY